MIDGGSKADKSGAHGHLKNVDGKSVGAMGVAFQERWAFRATDADGFGEV